MKGGNTLFSLNLSIYGKIVRLQYPNSKLPIFIGLRQIVSIQKQQQQQQHHTTIINTILKIFPLNLIQVIYSLDSSRILDISLLDYIKISLRDLTGFKVVKPTKEALDLEIKSEGQPRIS